ncbi:hypothetical protein D3C86_930810 [compost metagenome]
MRDHLQRNVVYPRQAFGWARLQLWQATAVAFGQVPLGQPDLFFDQVEVVQQPFVGRCDLAVLPHRLHQQRAGLGQQRLVFGQPRQQRVRRARCAHQMRVRQGLAVLLHLQGAEQLRAQRRLAFRRAQRGLASSKQVYPLGRGFEGGPINWFHSHRVTNRERRLCTLAHGRPSLSVA